MHLFMRVYFKKVRAGSHHNIFMNFTILEQISALDDDPKSYTVYFYRMMSFFYAFGNLPITKYSILSSISD